MGTPTPLVLVEHVCFRLPGLLIEAMNRNQASFSTMGKSESEAAGSCCSFIQADFALHPLTPQIKHEPPNILLRGRSLGELFGARHVNLQGSHRWARAVSSQKLCFQSGRV